MKKKFLSTMLIFALILLGAACNNKKEEKTNKKETENTVKKEEKTFKDSKGREIKVPDKIESVMLFNQNCYNMLKVIDETSKITGVSDGVKEAVKSGIKVYGKWNEPNVERIIEAKPQVFIGYSLYIKEDVEKKLTDAGIQVVYLDFYRSEDVAKEVRNLGMLFKKKEQAEKYAKFLEENNKLLEERLKGIKEDEKVKVYYEGYSDFVSAAKGTGGDDLVKRAGCINLAEKESAKYPKISAEWVIEKNPDLIVKITSNSKNILGIGIKDTAKAKELYDSIVKRAGWSNLKAVKDNKFIILASEIGTNVEGMTVGSMMIAKTAYPEKFKDVNPLEIYKKMRVEFFKEKGEDFKMAYPAGE